MFLSISSRVFLCPYRPMLNLCVRTPPPQQQQQHHVKPDISPVPPLIALWLPSNAETLVCHALSALPLPFIPPV